MAFIGSGHAQAQGFVAWLAAVLAVTSLRYRFSERFVRGAGESTVGVHVSQIARIGGVLFINGLLLAMSLMASATASHDLKQPLYCVNLFVAALNLRRLNQGPGEIAAHLAAVNQVLPRQPGTLLDISKLDAGVTWPQLKVVRLDLLAAQHHGAMAAVVKERGVGFLFEIKEEVSGLTDEALLTRVVTVSGAIASIQAADTAVRAANPQQVRRGHRAGYLNFKVVRQFCSA